MLSNDSEDAEHGIILMCEGQGSKLNNRARRLLAINSPGLVRDEASRSVQDPSFTLRRNRLNNDTYRGSDNLYKWKGVSSILCMHKLLE